MITNKYVETKTEEQKKGELTKRRKNVTREMIRVFLGRGLLSKICLGIVVIFVLMAVFAPLLTPYTPYEQALKDRFLPPSAQHLLGTDQLGRDLLTRVIFGARISLVTGFLSTCWGAALGVTLGLIAGYSSGFVQQFIMRIIDAQLSIPGLIFTMILVPVVGANIMGIGFIIGLTAIPAFTRMIYGQVLSLREQDYVTAAVLLGQSNANILKKHLLPNVFATVIVMFTMNVGRAIMAEAGLAYLGVGLNPPLPAWGSMVSEGYKYLTIYPHLALYPGFCLTILIVTLSIVGDGLRDSLDPKLRGKL
jgi:peptide/nickel transport system permease protein